MKIKVTAELEMDPGEELPTAVQEDIRTTVGSESLHIRRADDTGRKLLLDATLISTGFLFNSLSNRFADEIAKSLKGK